MPLMKPMKIATPSVISRSALFLTLTVCGVSLWLLYALGCKRVKEGARPAVAAAVQEPAAAAVAAAGTLDAKKADKEDHGVAACKNCQDLIAIYERVSKDFQAKGLDGATIKAIQPWFHGVQGEETPWPKRYEEFPEPLPAHSVRLLVIPLDSAPSLAAAASAITRDVLAVIPKPVKAFCNARTNYHCTVFHTSHPSDTRPDAFNPAGLGPDPAPPSQRPAPTDAALAAEAAAVAELVSSSRAPRLVVDRVVMASSGTLLITWVDPSGHLAELRQRLKSKFPGACSRQASIIHSSLMRLLSDEQLGPQTVAAVAEVCQRWTAKLQGRVLVPSTAWWVVEQEFSTIVGDRTILNWTQQ